MTYEEKYKSIGDIEKIKEQAFVDAHIALLLGGNSHRIKAIEDAMNKAIKELESTK